MSENIYCKSAFEAGDTFVLRCDTEYTVNEHKASAVITGTITSSNKYMCFYLKDDTTGASTSGKVLGGHYDVPNATVEHTFSNANWNYTSDGLTPVSDYCFPILYHKPDANWLADKVFYTNIPIFQTQDEAEAYQRGTLDISNAINYNKTLDENGNWVEVVEEKNELENTVVYSSEAQLLARRRIILAKKNILSNTCTCALEAGDTIIYECRSAFSNKYGTRFEKYINVSEIATEKNKRICMFISNIDDSSPYGIFYNLGSYNGYSALTIGGQTTYQTNLSTGVTTTLTNQNYTNVEPVPYVITSATQFDWSTSLFRTNIPIFSTKDEAVAYASGTLDVSNAINYKKILKNGIWVSV